MGTTSREGSFGARLRGWLEKIKLHCGHVAEKPSLECLACSNEYARSELVMLPCKHSYCRGCLNTFVQTLLEDPATGFPLRCCNNEKAIHERTILKYCEPAVYLKYKTAEAISSIPFEDRWYCPISHCRALTDKRTAHYAHGAIHCSTCQRPGCVSCRAPRDMDVRHECSDTATQSVLNLGKLSGWQQCWQCGTMIEMSSGCRFMRCSCCNASFW